MERYASGIINLAYRLVGSVADAEEIAQEVFLKLYQRPPHLAPSGKLFTWLYRVTVNSCIDFLRRKPSKLKFVSWDAPFSDEEKEDLPLAQTVADPAAASPREQVAAEETVQVVRQAVAALPLPLRAPLVLSALEGLSHEAIAETLGLTPKAVERRIARARSLLKSRLSAYL